MGTDRMECIYRAYAEGDNDAASKELIPARRRCSTDAAFKFKMNASSTQQVKISLVSSQHEHTFHLDQVELLIKTALAMF